MPHSWEQNYVSRFPCVVLLLSNTHDHCCDVRLEPFPNIWSAAVNRSRAVSAFSIPRGILHLVELDQSACAKASSDDDDDCAEKKDDVHCVFLRDRETQASCNGPGQENGVRVADHRENSSSENTPRCVEAEIDLGI